jgi:hypothetical protein
MREMKMRKYRGLTKEDKWVYGWYMERYGQSYIINIDSKRDVDNMFAVIPETVGQQVGPKDKKRTKKYPEGQEIYAGDVVVIGCYNLRAVIKYEHCSFRMFHVPGSDRRKYCGNGRSEPIFLNCDISTEIIGNIHQNPNLLGEVK